MRNWWIAFVAGAIVVGCAGGNAGTGQTTTGSGATTGTTATTGGTSTTGPTREVPTVTLPSNLATARVTFLSGQGRRAFGSQYAKLGNIRLKNGELNQVPSNISGSTDGTNVKLDGYSVNTYVFSTPVAADGQYVSLSMFLRGMSEEDFDGNLIPVFNGGILLPDLPISAKLSPGRTLTVQTYLNDGSLFFDGTAPVFDQAAWDQDNLLNGETAIPTFYADAIGFNISGLATKPKMKTGADADRLLLSGDAIGLAAGTQTDGSFDLYSPAFIESGVLTNPVLLVDTVAPGSYNVLEPDPSAIPPASPRIAALQGPWYEFNDVVKNGGSQVMLVIPTSHPSAPHQVVLMTRTGSTITNLWIGRANLTTSGGTFELWSVDQVDDNTENGKISGSFTNLTVTGGVIKDGDYTISSVGGAPFAASGAFAVYN